MGHWNIFIFKTAQVPQTPKALVCSLGGGEPTHSSFKANGTLKSMCSSGLTHGFWCKNLKCSARESEL